MAGWGSAPHAIGEQRSFTNGHQQAEVTALKAKHTAIHEANAALRPATLERGFA